MTRLTAAQAEMARLDLVELVTINEDRMAVLDVEGAVSVLEAIIERSGALIAQGGDVAFRAALVRQTAQALLRKIRDDHRRATPIPTRIRCLILSPAGEHLGWFTVAKLAAVHQLRVIRDQYDWVVVYPTGCTGLDPVRVYASGRIRAL